MLLGRCCLPVCTCMCWCIQSTIYCVQAALTQSQPRTTLRLHAHQHAVCAFFFSFFLCLLFSTASVIVEHLVWSEPFLYCVCRFVFNYCDAFNSKNQFYEKNKTNIHAKFVHLKNSIHFAFI